MLGPGTAQAAPTEAECSSTPATGKRIECTQASTSTTDISLDVDGVDISTEDAGEDGIKAEHAGGDETTSADITIDVTGTSNKNTISTMGIVASGIHGKHAGHGNVDIDVKDVTITTTNTQSLGIETEHSGTGDVDISATGIKISTLGMDASAPGVSALHSGSGNIVIDIQGKTTGGTTIPSTITTTSEGSQGIAAGKSSGAGDVTITLGNTKINTNGDSASGISVQKSPGSSGTMTATLNSGVAITTSGEGSTGVDLSHENTDTIATGDNVALTASGIKVTTAGSKAHGFWARREAGQGDVTMDISNSTIITESTGDFAIGIYGYKAGANGDGNIDIDITGGRTTTKGSLAFGVYAHHQNGDAGNDVTGDITIDLRGHTVQTKGTDLHSSLGGTFSYGIAAYHRNSGNILINLLDGPSLGTSSSITTLGENSHGIVAYHWGTADGRSMDITVGGSVVAGIKEADGTTEVTGPGAQGVRVGTVGGSGPERMASLDSDGYRLQTVTVNGPISSAGEGVFLANGGRVIIGPQGSIDSKSGLAILVTGTVPEDNSDVMNVIPAIPPKLYVDLDLNGRQVSQVINDGWILNDGGQTTIEVNDVVLHDGMMGVVLDENGDPLIVPNGAWDVHMVAGGVKVTDRMDNSNTMDIDESEPAHWTKEDLAQNVATDRDFSASDFTEILQRPPSPPPVTEPASEAMQVNEPVVAEPDAPAAIVVEDGGTVHIGSQGSVRATSGIAILAISDTPDDEPELTVEMDLDGRQVGQVIGDDWIINDGGGTTLVLNGVKLHDAATGVVPGAVAPNGAFNVRTEGPGVRVREEGVQVLDRSDPNPANWTISDPVEGLIADRDFSAADFVAAQLGTDPESPPMMIETYAPRSAVYEVLPDVLLGLQAGTPGVPRSRAPAWFTVTGHTGSQDFEDSTVGADYDLDYMTLEAGKHFTLENGTEAWASLQYLNGTADVDSPVQGGDIDVQGLGLGLVLCRGCEKAETYVLGQFSLSRYDLDLDSDTKGRLKSGVDATTYTLALEAGRRLQKVTYHLVPRVRLEHTSVSIDRFTDAMSMPTRVSYPNADRLTVALGVQAETSAKATQEGLSWYGSLDLEHRLDDAKTTARVMGERCEAEAGSNSVLLGAGATWQRDTLRINAGLTAREGLDTGAETYGARLNLALQF